MRCLKCIFLRIYTLNDVRLFGINAWCVRENDLKVLAVGDVANLGQDAKLGLPVESVDPPSTHHPLPPPAPTPPSVTLTPGLHPCI